MSESTGERLEQLAEQFFASAVSFGGTTKAKFCAEYKVSLYRLLEAFPGDSWEDLRNQWALTWLRPAMEEAYISAVVRYRFTIPAILSRLQGIDIPRKIFLRVAGDKWRKLKGQLPTVTDKVLMAINELIERRIPADEINYKLISETTGWRVPGNVPWLRDALFKARQQLLGNRVENEPVKPPDGVRGLTIGGTWIDLDADVWDLRPAGGNCIKRVLLRGDIADIAWTQLRDELLESHLVCATVSQHFRMYLWAGEILGGEVPEVREATLERVQRAWLNYEGTPRQFAGAGTVLRKIFTHLYSVSAEISGIDRSEMLYIVTWLYSLTSARRKAPKENFLSEEEMDALIAACLNDIKSGMDFTETGVDLLDLRTQVVAKENAAVVVNWAWSLMLLLSLFTGLRPQSVINLKIGDVVELHPNLYVVIWSHGKKREENVAVIPKPVALLIFQYVEGTAKLREALGTEKVFLCGNRNLFWSADLRTARLREALPIFIKRHGIRRRGRPLKLNSLIIRRTYVTRELYLGRSIWALRLQLGHSSLMTTRSYAKFDLYEHPGVVGASLDDYGRKSLTLWHHPLLLTELDPGERADLLGLKKERDQDVGVCRHNCCIKMMTGSPPPCSLCEHLVTGPEFLNAWDEEQKGRELEIARLQLAPGEDDLLIQKRAQYEIFKTNLAFVKGEGKQ